MHFPKKQRNEEEFISGLAKVTIRSSRVRVSASAVFSSGLWRSSSDIFSLSARSSRPLCNVKIHGGMQCQRPRRQSERREEERGSKHSKQNGVSLFCCVHSVYFIGFFFLICATALRKKVPRASVGWGEIGKVSFFSFSSPPIANWIAVGFPIPIWSVEECC